MIKKVKEFLQLLLKHSRLLRNIAAFILPSNIKLIKLSLQEEFLENYIYNYYDDDSLKAKRFYNIGAGNQRSRFNFWTYIDMETSKYDKKGIDIFYDLESLKPIPVNDNYTEVVFNSFVIEHISVNATKNLCKEAYRILKTGGVFHSKVYCYEYAYKLWKKGLITPEIPFSCRESNELIDDFIRKHHGKIKAYFNDSKEYVIQSIKKPSDQLVFTAGTSFIYHNAAAAYNNILKVSAKPDEVLRSLNNGNLVDFLKNLKEQYVDVQQKKPHQHNADYFPRNELFEFIKKLGFREVYFTQPFQSISPALWEERLNPIHNGFLFSIEAVK